MERLIRAFYASIAAFKFGWRSETAVRQELIVIVAALPLAFLLSSNPWVILAMWGSLWLVLLVEFLNTGIEKLADRVTTDHDELIGIAKDCGSAAVLVATILASAVWLLALWQFVFS